MAGDFQRDLQLSPALRDFRTQRIPLLPGALRQLTVPGQIFPHPGQPPLSLVFAAVELLHLSAVAQGGLFIRQRGDHRHRRQNGHAQQNHRQQHRYAADTEPMLPHGSLPSGRHTATSRVYTVCPSASAVMTPVWRSPLALPSTVIR